MELNKIYNMDCLEGMKLLPDKRIDKDRERMYYFNPSKGVVW